MSKAEKQLEKMRNNPRDWWIEDLKTIADKVGLSYRQPGTSHVTFRAKAGRMLTVPAKNRSNQFILSCLLNWWMN